MSKRLSGCVYFDQGQCRSCTTLGLSEPERDKAKLASLATIKAERVLPLFKPRAPFGSRYKAKLVVGGTTASPVIGFVDSSGAITEVLECPLHNPRLNELAGFIKTLIPKFNLTPYDIGARTGELKALILRSNLAGNALMARFTLRSKELSFRIKRALPELQAAFPELKVVSYNLQPLPAAVLEGPEEHLLTDEKFFWEDFGGCKLAFAPQTFSQVTPETAHALYAHVRAKLEEQPARGGMLDLYCGVGGFSYFAAPFVAWSRGVELSQGSIECAKAAQKPNAAPHLEFEATDVESWLEDPGCPGAEVVVVNPPRRGLSRSIIESLLRLSPSRIYYSSCNPETLARDLRALASAYRVRELAPFDMFPLTSHLEVIASLERI